MGHANLDDHNVLRACDSARSASHCGSAHESPADGLAGDLGMVL